MVLTPEVALLLLISFDPYHNTIKSFHVNLLISVDTVLLKIMGEAPGFTKPQTSKLEGS
jgi:hypothetical protein